MARRLLDPSPAAWAGRRTLAAALVATALLLASASPIHASATDAGYETYAVSAIDNVFGPDLIRIDPGGSVEWSMDGRSPHTVEADDGTWSSGELAPGDTFLQPFTQPGVYTYFCRYHGAPGVGMAGTIVVGDVPLPGRPVTSDLAESPVPGGFAPTVRVPADFQTIQQAVDHARPGGMVLIAPGTYREAVKVTTPYITIRGEDRNTAILDGDFRLANGIHVIEADGVTVQNLTARNFLLNGFYWSSVHGYWGSFLTAYNNGDYGVYAYDSDWGQFDHSYASGSPDAGFYIGQCNPCHSLITDVLAENNALGYSGTNASGDLAIVNSEWRNNMGGIVPNTLDSEELPPQGHVLVAGNYVHDNNNADAPAKPFGYLPFGTGIVVAGGVGNTVTSNLVEDHVAYGIGATGMVDANLWWSRDNEFRDNVVQRSGRADLALAAPSAGGDCFEGNDFGSSQPPGIEVLYACDGPSMRGMGGGDPALTVELAARFLETMDDEYPHGEWETQPTPSPQAAMPGAVDAPPMPAIPEQAVPRLSASATLERSPRPPVLGSERSSH